jgi:hypothetical protein
VSPCFAYDEFYLLTGFIGFGAVDRIKRDRSGRRSRHRHDETLDRDHDETLGRDYSKTGDGGQTDVSPTAGALKPVISLASSDVAGFHVMSLVVV